MKLTHANRTLLLSALLGASAIAAPARAQLSLNVYLAPPKAQYEIIPSIQPGYVWAPGYWSWTGNRHVWIGGRPIERREGFLWEPDRWDQRGRSYFLAVGHWRRDLGHRSVEMTAENQPQNRPDDDRGDRRDGQRGHDGNGRHGRGDKHAD